MHPSHENYPYVINIAHWIREIVPSLAKDTFSIPPQPSVIICTSRRIGFCPNGGSPGVASEAPAACDRIRKGILHSSDSEASEVGRKEGRKSTFYISSLHERPPATADLLPRSKKNYDMGGIKPRSSIMFDHENGRYTIRITRGLLCFATYPCAVRDCLTA